MKKIIYSLPFLMLSFSGIIMPFLTRLKRTGKAHGIYWFYLHLVVASYYIFTRVSPNITGALWLAFSIITLEIIYWLQKRHGERMPEKGEPDRFLLHMAYLLIGAFLIRHLAVHLHTTEYIGIFRVRFLVALGAIITFTYWTLRKLPERKNSAKSWMYVHPLFLDLNFAFSIFTVVVEVNSRCHTQREPFPLPGHDRIGVDTDSAHILRSSQKRHLYPRPGIHRRGYLDVSYELYLQ